MYIVIEYVPGCQESINIMCQDDGSGKAAIFDTYETAENAVAEYCAWDSKVVKL